MTILAIKIDLKVCFFVLFFYFFLTFGRLVDNYCTYDMQSVLMKSF